MQVGGGFQQLAAGGRQLVQGLERGEQQVGDIGHLAGVLERDAVAPAHVFHLAALVAAEAGKFRAHVAGGQVGDDAVAHAGARVVDRRQMELLQELEQHGHARHDDLGAARPDAGDLAPAGEVPLRQLAVELAHLRGGDAQAVDLLALGARHAGHGAGHGRGGGRGGDGAVPARVAQAAHGGIELVLDVLVHLVQLERGGRIVLEKNLAQPHRAQRLGEGLAQAAVFGGDDLRAAAADIDDQRRACRSAARCSPRPGGSGALLRGRR